jgi:ParB/RepB/Spo0J family partition protein
MYPDVGTLGQIPISQIDEKDTLFEVSFLPDLTVLKESIQRQGILNPILVRQHKNKLQIISGFRRYYCAKTLRMSNIPVLEVDVFHNDLSLFERAIEESFFSRPLNLVEKGAILYKLESCFGVTKAEVIEKYMPRLALSRSEKMHQFYRDLLDLNTQIQMYIVQNELPVHVVEDFLRFSEAEQKLLLPYLDRVHFSVATLKEFLIWIDEVVVRDDLDVQKILSDPAFKKILDDRLMPAKQKHQSLKKHLKIRRYPRLSELEQRFVDLRGKLNLPLEQTDFFETNRVQMKFSFADKKELSQWVERMSSALGKPELEEMFKKL